MIPRVTNLINPEEGTVYGTKIQNQEKGEVSQEKISERPKGRNNHMQCGLKLDPGLDISAKGHFRGICLRITLK